MSHTQDTSNSVVLREKLPHYCLLFTLFFIFFLSPVNSGLDKHQQRALAHIRCAAATAVLQSSTWLGPLLQPIPLQQAGPSSTQAPQPPAHSMAAHRKLTLEIAF